MTSRFLLLVHADPAGWEGLDEQAADEALRDRTAAIERLSNDGVLIACSPLAEPAAARRVVVRDGDAQVSPAAAQMTVRELMPLPGVPGVIPDPVEGVRDRG